MKLRNKETGNIGWLYCDHTNSTEKIMVFSEDKDLFAPHWSYNSLAELNEEWEDYEEPKEHWCVTMYGGITRIKDDEEPIDDLIEIGNYFNSKEDAYDAWDKLKAWKRLKDKKFQFHGHNALGFGEITFSLDFEDMDDEGEIGQLRHDLDLLFGGEE